MSGNNTCVTELSCADSPLSTTGNIIGILTLAYAILVTIVFQANALANVDKEIKELGPRLEAEYESLKRTSELFREFQDRFPEPITSKVDFTTKHAASIITHHAFTILLPEAYGYRWVPWSLRRLFRRNTFLINKRKLNSALGTAIEKRLEIEGMCSSALNRLVDFVFQTIIMLQISSLFEVFRLVIEEIDTQNSMICQQHDMIRAQNLVLEQIMDALQLNHPGLPGVSHVPDDEDPRTPTPESERFDVLENYLRQLVDTIHLDL